MGMDQSAFAAIGVGRDTDVEVLELADTSIPHTVGLIYRGQARYEFSLQSLMRVLFLALQNLFYVLQAAETAYTASEFAL